MRLIFLFISIIIFFYNANAQILNAGFEHWTSGEPDNWLTTNKDPYYPVTQTTDAHGGSYAIKGTVVGEQTPYGFSAYITSVGAGYDGKGFPFTGRPDTLRGFLKFLPKGGDLFGLNVGLLKNNKPIGAGGYGYSKTDTAYHEFAVPISYTNSTAIPDRITINFEITGPDGNSAMGHEGSTFYVDDISAISLTKPIANDIIISGEKDTIKWITGGAENINLDYSLDEGNSWQNIVSNYPADSSKYVWDVVPKDLLSRKGRVRIEDSNNKDNNDKRAVKFKPWQLTRVDANGDFELFEPGQDGWAFPNDSISMYPDWYFQQFDYKNGNDPNTGTAYPGSKPFSVAKSAWFPSWPIFVDAFGISQCYYTNPPTPGSYIGRATTEWVAIKDTAWGGSCYGFAVTSLLYFYHKSNFLALFPGLDNFHDLFSDRLNTSSRLAINQFFVHQYGDPYQSYDNQRWSSVDARQTLQELKDMLGQDNTDAKPLGFYNPNGSGGHEITAYKLERVKNTSTFNLRCYDSNHPGLTNRGIILDSLADKWTEATGFGWGTGKTGCTLGIESAEHLNTPILTKRSIFRRKVTFGSTQSSVLTLYNTSDADINIISNSGVTTGYVDSTLFNNITGAVPIIPKTGYPHPPIGYYLPKGTYSVHLSNSSDSFLHAFFMTDSTIYNYRRYDADSNETDNLNYSDGIGIENPDTSIKNINIETIIDNKTSEKDYETNNIRISQDDSINIKEIDRKDLLLNNYGTGKNYDLRLRSASDNGEKLFFHSQVQLASNSAHQIVPDWGNLETSKVKILIDNGNDGTIDDSMFISNEITEIKGRNSSSIPIAFTLHQNYPNPFNPTTTIKYDLPKQAHVILKVYNILGQEVATLVNGVKRAGSYEVKFDGSKLSSGIYFYRLKAGQNIMTKKMILLQ